MSSRSSLENTTYTFTLTKKAKSKGGDCYNCSDIENFNIYVPQEISRKNGTEPKKTLTITIE
jgi:hypothetical protein